MLTGVAFAELQALEAGNVHRRRTVRVRFTDGNELTTDINGTVEECKAYYIGKLFNMVEDTASLAVSVEFLD